MSQRNNQTFKKNLGSFSRPNQTAKPSKTQSVFSNSVKRIIGVFDNGGPVNKSNGAATAIPGTSTTEKAHFLNGFAIGMIAGVKLPELQGLKGLPGLNGDTLSKLPDFHTMTEKELDSWIDKYAGLIDKL